ncbi:MAG: MraY family glycosyltransferase [Candidatus Omnitrophica bacterium]|nr:MraY family glycosyltransferase [Candidatus Omnitrophota bacterium]
MLRYFIVFSGVLVFSMLSVLVLGKWALRRKLLQAQGVPLVGGIAIFVSFTAGYFFGAYVFGVPPGRIIPVIGVSSLVFLFGLVDDLKELSVLQKFLFQSACAVALISLGVSTDIMYLGFWGNALVTFFWILGVTNAFNLLDIMDALAAGVAVIVSSALLTVSFLNPDINMQICFLVLCAASLGFLVFNLPPARAYLGNSGSHLLGFLICAFVLILRYASEENAFALLSPVLILWLPIIDTLLLIVFRVMKRKIPFKKSDDHIAFRIRLHAAGPVKTILFMFLLCLIFSSAGVLLTRVSNYAAIAIIITVFFSSVILFWKLIQIDVREQ